MVQSLPPNLFACFYRQLAAQTSPEPWSSCCAPGLATHQESTLEIGCNAALLLCVPPVMTGSVGEDEKVTELCTFPSCPAAQSLRRPCWECGGGSQLRQTRAVKWVKRGGIFSLGKHECGRPGRNTEKEKAKVVVLLAKEGLEAPEL